MLKNDEKVRESEPSAYPAETTRQYIDRIIAEARIWEKFAEEHSNLSRHRIHSIAMDAVGFSLNHSTKALAIPSKLVGTMESQDVLEAIVELGESRVQELAVEQQAGKLNVYYGASRLGWIWPRHAWVWPLMAAGAKVYMTKVTGTDEVWKNLGLNVAIGHVVAAIRVVEGAPLPVEIRPEQGDGAVDEPDWPAVVPEPPLRRTSAR